MILIYSSYLSGWFIIPCRCKCTGVYSRGIHTTHKINIFSNFKTFYHIYFKSICILKFKNLNGSEKIYKFVASDILALMYITCTVRINFPILITYDSFPNFPFLVLLWNLFYGFSMQLLQAYLSYTHTPHHLELILWLKVCNRYDGFFETMFKEIKMHFLYSVFFPV